jgi:hypothetical protein
LKPGQTSFSFRYRVPSGSDGAQLDLRFPRPVAALHVMVADTGVVIETDRLHRRRPVRSGTRVYLHREAFQVAAGETVEIGLRPIAPGGLPRAASVSAVVALVLISVWVVSAPLRGRGAGVEHVSPESEVGAERALLYATIRDLDHDYETGKLSEPDYLESRQALRAQAVEMLRRERAADLPEESAPSVGAAAESTAGPTLGGFCPGCGQRVDPAWRFCSHCGGGLSPAASESGSDG